jgi:glutamine---fructose-6-phosphate transaminase (isomerizing)
MTSITPDTNPYLRDLLDQPLALQNTLAGLQDTSNLLPLAQRLASGEFQRVLLTGMGSSYHALHPLHFTLLTHGLNSMMMEASELIHYAPSVLDARTLVVVVSQSGRSIEIVRLLKEAKGRSLLMAVTNNAVGPLAQAADGMLLTQAGAETTVSCKTYIVSLAALTVLGELLTGVNGDVPPASLYGEMNAVIPLMTDYLSHWESHVQRLTEILSTTRHLIIAGRGSSLAAVCTGGLIIKESAHFPTEGLSAAAFRHGPFEMTSPNLFVAVLEGDERTAALNRNLVADVQAVGGQSVLIGQAQPEPAFTLPAVPASARPLLEILPLQMMSLALAQLNGHDAGNFTLATKVTATE